MILNRIEPAVLQLIEVYSTRAGAIFQSDCDECWYVHFGGKIVRLNYHSLKSLKYRVENICVETLLLDPCKGNDYEIISVGARNHFYILSAMEILDFKELLQGTFVMLKLNHLIKDCLCRVI